MTVDGWQSQKKRGVRGSWKGLELLPFRMMRVDQKGRQAESSTAFAPTRKARSGRAGRPFLPTCSPKSARGLAQSKTWRSSRRPRDSRSVLECGSPLPLLLRHGRRVLAEQDAPSFPRAHPKAPEDWRSPRPGGVRGGTVIREASWSAVVLCRSCNRFFKDCEVPGLTTTVPPCPSRKRRGRMPQRTCLPRQARISSPPAPTSRRTTSVAQLAFVFCIVDSSPWPATLAGSSKHGRFSPITTISSRTLPPTSPLPRASD